MEVKKFHISILHWFRRKGRNESFFWRNLLGYTPNHLELYTLALTHRSASRGSNERLEFLGDAVLGLVIAEELYRLYPNETEGKLTRMRAKIVCRENMNHIAHQIGLTDHLVLGQVLKSNAENIYGNALEALIGAIYLESGQARAEQFIKRYIVGKDQSTLMKLIHREVDFKSRLLEWGQAHRKTVRFVCLTDRYEATSDTHTFVYAVHIDDKEVAQAAGHTKLLAQQQTARKALQQLNALKE